MNSEDTDALPQHPAWRFELLCPPGDALEPLLRQVAAGTIGVAGLTIASSDDGAVCHLVFERPRNESAQAEAEAEAVAEMALHNFEDAVDDAIQALPRKRRLRLLDRDSENQPRLRTFDQLLKPSKEVGRGTDWTSSANYVTMPYDKQAERSVAGDQFGDGEPSSASELAEMLRGLPLDQPELIAARQEELTAAYLETYANREQVVAITLGDIALRMAQAAAIRDELQRLVDVAREHEVKWTDIGRAAGITSQAAWRRWDPTARKKHADYQKEQRAEKARESEAEE